MKILAFILSIYTTITVLVFGTDFCITIIERYSHFRIGKWADEERWKDAVANVCRKWTIKTPILRIKKDCRYALVDLLRGTYGKAMVQSWQKAGCAIAVNEYTKNTEFRDTYINSLIAKDGTWKIQINKIDYAMLAYSVLNSAENPNTVKPAMDKMLHCILENVCEDGMVSYSAGKNAKRRYVDTLGFVCPFLGCYGRFYNEQKWISFAVEQIQKFRVHGMYRGLPIHCFRATDNQPMGIIGWGRGTGWYCLGLIDLYPSVSAMGDKEELKKWIHDIAFEIMKYERADGGFSAILASDGPYDSSATAMLGYFLAKAYQIFDEDEMSHVAKRCCEKLKTKTKFNGVVDECQGDTVDIGIFSERYAEMPFAQGMTLRLIAILEEDKKYGREENKN